mmetsp:Transcript_12825/g.19089  ORF Transcript_12825/g.19089 Transcript_12825/m.19089 type:complete len:124 (+) Transcript_12825:64-435(+)
MHARLRYASEQSKNTHPTKVTPLHDKISPHPHQPTSPSQALISTESCYCCFVLFQTSAFIIPITAVKIGVCISQSCAIHFNVIQESNRVFHPSNPAYDDCFNSSRLGRSILHILRRRSLHIRS